MTTLAEINLNPLNLEISTPPTAWVGADKNQRSPEQMGVRRSQTNRFVKFTEEKWGWRAAAKNVLFHWKGGKNTLRKLIHAWCPPFDGVTGKQHTDGYVQNVARSTGFDPDAVLDFRLYDVIKPTIWAMHIVEAGKIWGNGEALDEGLASIGIGPVTPAVAEEPELPPQKMISEDGGVVNKPEEQAKAEKVASGQVLIQAGGVVTAATAGMATVFKLVGPIFAGVALLMVVGFGLWAAISFARMKKWL